MARYSEHYVGSYINYFYACSVFDGNNGGSSATIDLSFHSGIFNNSMFRNNRGSVIRVSLLYYTRTCIAESLI